MEKDTPKGTSRRSKVAPKHAIPAEMVVAPAPVLDLTIDGSNVGAFRAFGRVNKKVLAFTKSGTKNLEAVYETVEAVTEWLTTYGAADEAEVDQLSFEQLVDAWEQVGAVYKGTNIPQTKSAS